MHKIKVIIAMRIIYPLFKIIPVNTNLIFFEASQGRYTSNPKYLYLELLNDPRFDDYAIIWSLRNESQELERVKTVKIYSLKYLYVLATAGTFINDNMWHPAMKKRKKQIFIQTWHGTPLKKIARDTNVPSNDPQIIKRNQQYTESNSKLFDLMVSSSKYTTSKFRNAFGYDGEILSSGTPRVDYLIHNKNLQLKDYPEFEKVILIAPSFRKSLSGVDQYNYFYEGFKLKELATMFPNYCFLLKLHNYAFIESRGQYNNIIDVSDVEDISTLYLNADVLLTDYSSTIFDYSILNRTAILFPFDFDFKQQKITVDNEPLYLPLLENILPGTVIENFELLVKHLKNLSKDELSEFTEYENGSSSHQILNWIYTKRKEFYDKG